jgi:predicted transcriptional regulator
MNSKEVLKEIRTLLGFSEEKKEEVQMEEAMLVDGTIISWEGELAVGTAIFVQTGEGLIPAPDATHEVEGGLLVSTEGGIVTEIVEPTEVIEEEVALEEVAVEVPEEVSAVVTAEVLEAIAEAIAPVLEEVAMLKEEMKKMKSGFSMTVDLVEKVANLPSEEPTKAPAKLSKKEEQFANIMKLAQHLKNKKNNGI